MVRTIHVFIQFIDESRERQRETEAILPVSHHRRSSGASVGTLNAFKVNSIVLYEQKNNCHMMLHNSFESFYFCFAYISNQVTKPYQKQ